MRHAIDDQVVYLNPADLKPNPENQGVHADIDILGRDAWLFRDIETYGVQSPLLIFPDKIVSDGHRRRALSIRAKQETVPCIVVRSKDAAASFSSAQLARQMSVFAKCVLYRKVIDDLCTRTLATRLANLPNGDKQTERGDADAVQQEWIQCEEVLGISRRVLGEGVAMLAMLEKLVRSADPTDRERAGRGLQVFRNRGLRPAQRMMGVARYKPKAGEPADDDADCAEGWQDEPVQMASRTKKPKATKKETADDSPATLPMPETIPWPAEILTGLARMEQLLSDNGFDLVKFRAARKAIEKELAGREVKSPAKRRAA